MHTHLDHVKEWYPNILKARSLDLGSGLGSFLIDIAKAGGTNAVGIESSAEHIEVSEKTARDLGLTIHVTHNVGESLPFPDNSFDFVNMSELIEHVDSPLSVLKEVRRVLKPEGVAYMSVPNRYSFRDGHFRIYFVNWLPRFCANAFISMFGRHKDYTRTDIGVQRLDKMHYYTFGQISRLCRSLGFNVSDLRISKIRRKYGRWAPFVFIAYFPLRFLFFQSAHVKLEKPN